ncbi:MAG: hypothetical protein ACREQQ_18200 [Candidatus Binatia bacterium]
MTRSMVIATGSSLGWVTPLDSRPRGLAQRDARLHERCGGREIDPGIGAGGDAVEVADRADLEVFDRNGETQIMLGGPDTIPNPNR